MMGWWPRRRDGAGTATLGCSWLRPHAVALALALGRAGNGRQALHAEEAEFTRIGGELLAGLNGGNVDRELLSAVREAHEASTRYLAAIKASRAGEAEITAEFLEEGNRLIGCASERIAQQCPQRQQQPQLSRR